jgi:serine/threonine-protein kinase
MSAYASTPINNNVSAPVVSGVSNNFSLYSNSSYGIEFQPPQAWDKIEVLDGSVTLIEYTSPPRNETETIELPAQVVISIEKGLGNVTTLQQYGEGADRLLKTVLGNFTSTSQPTILSGLPAISRTMATMNPVSGTDILIAQIFAIKNGNAYTITYTAPSSIYYNYLPTVQQIINSFQITK